jgi:hypothetical protein
MGAIIRPPARSRLLRAYGALVPRRARARIKKALPSDVRAFLTRRMTGGGPLARVADLALQGWLRLRYAHLLRTPGVVLAYAGRRLVLARAVPRPTALESRRANLRTVLDLLAPLGVPHFCVRGFDDLAAAVAVAEPHRAAILRALADLGRSEPIYLAEVDRHRPGPLRPPNARTRRRLRDARVVRVVGVRVDPTGSLVAARGTGCDIEFWSELDGALHAPRSNRSADTVPVDGRTVVLGEPAFTRLASAASPPGLRYETRGEMSGPLLDDVTFPIDVVYTWVNGDDPAWQRRRDAALGILTEVLNRQSANASRFATRDELRYSFRSLAMFAPWVRRIFLVTDDQVPEWLDVDHPQVTIVSHRELFAGRGVLPTFNSHAIESQLHRIEGLSEHFIYLNDDVFLGRPLTPDAFFHPNGIAKIYLSRAKVDAGAVDVDRDIPATAAGKNNRRLISQRFGRRVTYKMKHVPHAMRRSVLTEIESRFAAELTATARHQFRHPADVSLASSLYQYYATLTGCATPADVRYLYADLADAETPSRLRLLLARRNYDLFCLNDTDSDPESLDRQRVLLGGFLSAYFPVRSPWEVADRAAGPRETGPRGPYLAPDPVSAFGPLSTTLDQAA